MYFRPIALMVTLAVIFVLCKLGAWQLQRAQEKSALLDSQLQQQNNPITDWAALSKASELNQNQLIYVDLQGRLDSENIWFLDNAVVSGKVGYDVISLFYPIIDTSSDQVPIVVNLGWVAAPSTRDRLPEVVLDSQVVKLRGVINMASEQPFVLSHSQQDIAQRIQFIDLLQITEQVGTSVYSHVLHVGNSQSLGLISHYKVINMPPEKHQAYAMQWFSLALAAAVVFIFASLNREKHSRVKEKVNAK